MNVAINGLAARGEGALTYLVGLLPELAAVAHDCRFVVYLNPTGKQAVADRLRDADGRIEIREIAGAEARFRRVLWEETILPAALRRDAIHVLYVPGASLPSRCGCPTVAAIRNMEPYARDACAALPARERLRLAYLRRATGRTLKRASRVILVSAATLPVLREHHRFDVDRTAVIHHGRDPFFRPVAPRAGADVVRDRFGVAEPFILYTSKTRPYKRHLELVNAFAELRRRGRREQLVIAGERQQPYYGEVAQQVRTLGLPGVQWLGALGPDALLALYNACTVFAYPSACEACPNILIEAMACGLPIVAADTPVNREIAGDAALYCDSSQPALLADALDRVLADAALRSEYRARALRRAGHFSWRRAADQVLDVLREAAAGSPVPARQVGAFR